MLEAITNAFTEVLKWISICTNAINEWFGLPISEIAIIGLTLTLVIKLISKRR